MSTLTGLYISQSYGGLIHLSTNTGLVTGSFTQLQDGLGTDLKVWVNGTHLSASISASVANLSQLTASGLNYPSADGDVDMFIKTDGAGTLTLADVNTIYEDVYTGENVTKGDPLYISGSQGATPRVFKADAAVAAKMPVTYIASETINAGNATRGIVLGKISGLNLTGYPAGTDVYVAAGGGWTATRPTGSAIVQLLGIVTKEGAGGQGLILNPGPANLPNLTAGSVWVGNASGVPTATPISSLTTFPYTGSAVITGSFTVTGSIAGNTSALTISSNTASVDLSRGNLFTLTLVSGSIIHINPTNIKSGQTSMIRITQPSGGGGSVSFSPAVKFPTGLAYTASIGSNVMDTIALVSFDGTTLQAIASYNFS